MPVTKWKDRLIMEVDQKSLDTSTLDLDNFAIIPLKKKKEARNMAGAGFLCYLHNEEESLGQRKMFPDETSAWVYR